MRRGAPSRSKLQLLVSGHAPPIVLSFLPLVHAGRDPSTIRILIVTRLIPEVQLGVGEGFGGEGEGAPIVARLIPEVRLRIGSKGGVGAAWVEGWV